MKKNLRIYTLSKAEQADFNPVTFTARLMEAGFKFDNVGCPVKITKPWDRLEAPSGVVTYRQWDE